MHILLGGLRGKSSSSTRESVSRIVEWKGTLLIYAFWFVTVMLFRVPAKNADDNLESPWDGDRSETFSPFRLNNSNYPLELRSLLN